MNTYTLNFTNFTIEDAPVEEKFYEDSHKYEVLERYYNDIYKLFLTKLTNLDCATSVCERDKRKLQQLLHEIIYVKTLLAESRDNE